MKRMLIFVSILMMSGCDNDRPGYDSRNDHYNDGIETIVHERQNTVIHEKDLSGMSLGSFFTGAALGAAATHILSKPTPTIVQQPVVRPIYNIQPIRPISSNSYRSVVPSSLRPQSRYETYRNAPSYRSSSRISLRKR